MELVALLGRVLFSAMFVMSGIAHVTKRRYMAEYAAAMGVPSADIVVPASGVMIVVGGVMTALGLWGDLGALLIAAFLIPAALWMHAYWKVDDDQAKQQQQTHFMKNLSLAGGALGLMALFVCGGDRLGLTLTGPLFG